MTRLGCARGLVGCLFVGMGGGIGWVVGAEPAGDTAVVEGVPGQPLAANVERVAESLAFLGAPLDEPLRLRLAEAARERDADALQALLDPLVLLSVHINPEYRVAVRRGPARAELLQHGFTPFLVKVENRAAMSGPLAVRSPQAGPVFGGAAESILERQQQTELQENPNPSGVSGARFLTAECFTAPPMTPRLSGLEVEYVVLLVSSSEAGKREALVGFEVGQGTQDIGFRAEAPVLFEVRPAVPVRLAVRDHDGTPTVARLTFRDRFGRVFPPQAKRVAPDLFFQPQVYRGDGGSVLLPPGEFEVTSTRGPEYVEKVATVNVPETGKASLEIELERWIDPSRFGFACGDHHIHGAGCAHYTEPTEGIRPEDMFLQVKGEGLHVGCVLTWGPCYDFQRRFFSPGADGVSEPLTVLKYDLEISGFGSAALGHVCLLNLRDQTYPGSGGTKEKGWPTWTVPVMRWAKEQGGFTGYPHSDLFVDARGAAGWLVRRHDGDGDGALSRDEAAEALLPESFEGIDRDESGTLSANELERSSDRRAGDLPNLVLPSMNGAGAMEIFVSAAEGVCDFTSAMNTARVGEWNTWYHLMNCGLPVKLSGETDFPCMSSRRVGQGRVYVRLSDGPVEAVDFESWCRGLAEGRSYVSDGFAHAVDFTVEGTRPGEGRVALDEGRTVAVSGRVAFAPVTPAAVAHGTLETAAGRRVAGDTRVLHAPRTDDRVRGGERRVEIVVNGVVVAEATVPADGGIHDLSFDVPVARSSWIALRQFPQLHTNPVEVIVGGRPIRASSASARWCAEAVEILWENRHRHIAEPERPAARAAYDRARALYRRRAGEASR